MFSRKQHVFVVAVGNEPAQVTRFCFCQFCKRNAFVLTEAERMQQGRVIGDGPHFAHRPFRQAAHIEQQFGGDVAVIQRAVGVKPFRYFRFQPEAVTQVLVTVALVLRQERTRQLGGADPRRINLRQLGFVELRVVSDVGISAHIAANYFTEQRRALHHVFCDMVNRHGLKTDRHTWLNEVAHWVADHAIDNIDAGDFHHSFRAAFQPSSFGVDHSQ